MFNETIRAVKSRHHLRAIIRNKFPENFIAQAQDRYCLHCIYHEMQVENPVCVHDLLPIGLNGQACYYFVTRQAISVASVAD